MASQDSNITGWITVQGRRVPIRKGQSKAEAVKSNFNAKKGEGKTRAHYQSNKEGRYYKDYNDAGKAKTDAAKETKRKGTDLVTTEKIGIKSAHKKRRLTVGADGKPRMQASDKPLKKIARKTSGQKDKKKKLSFSDQPMKILGKPVK